MSRGAELLRRGDDDDHFCGFCNIRGVSRCPKNRSASEGFNLHYPIGTPVRYWPGSRDGGGREGTTRSAAWRDGSGKSVVMVTGFPRFVALTHVEPMLTAESNVRDEVAREETR